MNEQQTYIENQRKWVKNCKLKKGSELVVIATASSKQGGWNNRWVSTMSTWVGRTVQYECVDKYQEGDGVSCHSYGAFASLPFYVLVPK